MKLYDGVSPINWFYHGVKTAEEMAGDFRFPQPGQDAVLFDNGSDVVFDWLFLEEIASRYGIEFTTSQETFDAVLVEAKKPRPPEVTPQRLQDVGEAAASAQESAVTLASAVAELGGIVSITHQTSTDTEAAAAELGVMAAQVKSDSADTQAAVAELGGMVADLTVRVTALESAKA